MKNIAGFLFSPRLMAVLMGVFAISIGLATFFENDFGSLTARNLVYNAHWFEVLLLVGAVNLTGRIFIKKLFKRSKFSVFLFHISFVIILAGAGVTRYTGYEGTLSIREGQTTNQLTTDKTYVQLIFGSGPDATTQNFRISFNPLGSNKLNKKFVHNGHTFHLKGISYIPNAYETIMPHEGGVPVAEFIYVDSTGRKSMVIASGELQSAGKQSFGFNLPMIDSLMVNLTVEGDSLSFLASYPVSHAGMSGEYYTLLEQGVAHIFIPRQIYTFKDQMIVLNRFFPQGRKVAVQSGEMEGPTYDAMTVELSSEGQRVELILLGKSGYTGISEKTKIQGTEFILSYGSLTQELPFKLRLNDFIVERYPGSRSPSAFESRVTLSDEGRNVNDSRRIYMNNILKYRGYRFYQASYDPDEKGTILSVNHDLAGTSITYTGYFLMGLGMVISLFNRNSRFRELLSLKKERSSLSKTVLTVLILFATTITGRAQDNTRQRELVAVDKEHAAAFGKLLIQDNNGRIEPISTLSAELLRKLTRKSTYKGMNSDQVFLGMVTDPAMWQYEPLIRTTHPEIQEILGSGHRYYPFTSFFKNNNYILQEYVESAFRKKPALRTKFDNEIIRLDERVNISYLVFSGDFLRIFPVPGDSTHTWYNHEGVRGKIVTADSVFVENIFFLYAREIQESLKSGNWEGPAKFLNAMNAYQNKFSGEIIPTTQKVDIEILLNKSDIFSRISTYYGVVGFILLILQFAGLFYARLKLKIPVIISMVVIIIIFLLHTTGLGLRWYVSGHAPWSNGYEALTYVAWATVLAGLIFASRSSITLSVTSVLAFLILFVAHLSWMDPQITNLVPVLKSYWLVIHVATITASYGFLAMGALLAFIDLVLMVLQTQNNRHFLYDTIDDISHTIEMSLTIGLYLLTIGVFLGAVWANESWGRYWGWDPKETWALITVLVYAFILHMRYVPGLKGNYAFNLASLLGFSSVIMTYFGVNYYLSGLHSYAKGDPLPVPAFVYWTLAVVALTGIMAYYRNRASQGKFSLER